MRLTCLFAVLLLLCSGCKKNSNAYRTVNLHLLSSFTIQIDTLGYPARHSIVEAVLDPTPFVRNEDIVAYTQADHTFHLKRNIKPLIKDFAGDKAFAVTVDGVPIYYGRFHPAYYSSILFGLATIDPLLHTTESSLTINYAMTGMAVPNAFDKRNDPAIIAAMMVTRRLR